MKLGTLTFQDDPEDFTPPRSQKTVATIQTYSSAAYFSWGLSVVGTEILLEWPYMTCDQFNWIDALYQADAQVEWDPEIVAKIFHGAVSNGPFVIGKTLTGNGSGATGTVLKVFEGETYLEYTPVSGAFTVAETFHDNSAPQKSATITSVERIPKYNVEIRSLDGKYVTPAGATLAWRQDVKLGLFILGGV